MVNETQNSQWFNAASSGDIKELYEKIKKGLYINIKNDEGKTALILAAEKGLTNVVKFLLGINNERVLDLVLEWKNDHDLSNEYIKQWNNNWISANINARDKTGKIALFYAIKEGYYDTVKLLIDTGADVNVRDTDEYTPLILAIEKHHADIAKWLIDAGADVNAVSRTEFNSSSKSGGYSALIRAVEIGSESVTKWLIEAGADVNVRDSYGQTALIIASNKGLTKMVELLIKAGANVCIKDRLKRTAFYYAQNNEYFDIEDLLKNADAIKSILCR